MSDTIDTTRALLRMFQQSGYGDIHVRSGDFAIFIARHAGQVNPLRGSVVRAGVVPVAEAAGMPGARTIIAAPHIASMVSAIAPGSAVDVGDHVARIELLGESIDLVAEQRGFIQDVAAQPGQLLEYGAPIVTIIATH
ncbi:biotin/lipoyl-containing protein [Sphingobium boeckii]|uniref:Biotin carboxyl carrier protein n=1 Tax=Sphingobium boeckii TaxID=1082345 RepID=A0A7W9AHW8_9SPHN|nr:biotin/lipoyl-containing protein [Sphingobium boeckii]MBB5685888.1 biotin carboxyl carrier protein [Sphingobium boeckii]